MTPLVTVYIPTRNRAALLRQALKSLELQTLESRFFRVVVSDNCSDDNTGDVVRGCPSLQMVHVRRATNLGVLANFEAAREFFDTPYFAFLSDDDLLAPFHLEYLLRALERDRAAVLWAAGHQIGTGLWETDTSRPDLRLGDRYIDPRDQTCHWSSRAWLAAHSVSSAVCLNASLIRSSALKRITPLFADEFPDVTDRWLMARLGTQGAVATIPWATCALRVHGSNLIHGRFDGHVRRQTRRVAERVLDLASSLGLDLAAFWREHLTKPDPTLMYRIYETYPRDVAESALSGWVPPRSRLDRMPLPRRVRTWLRGLAR